MNPAAWFELSMRRQPEQVHRADLHALNVLYFVDTLMMDGVGITIPAVPQKAEST